MFEELVGLIDKIKDDSIGEWIVDKENDGTPEHPIQMPFVVYSRIDYKVAIRISTRRDFDIICLRARAERSAANNANTPSAGTRRAALAAVDKR